MNPCSCAKYRVRPNKLNTGFGAEKNLLLPGPGKEKVACVQKDPHFLVVFSKKFLKAKFGVKAVDCVTFF